ncbi:MAG: hypothetical protein ACLUD2_01755 [Clostridium sp.]
MSETAKWFSGWLAAFSAAPGSVLAPVRCLCAGRKQNELRVISSSNRYWNAEIWVLLIIYQNEQTPTGEVRLANHAGEVYVTCVPM